MIDFHVIMQRDELLGALQVRIDLGHGVQVLRRWLLGGFPILLNRWIVGLCITDGDIWFHQRNGSIMGLNRKQQGNPLSVSQSTIVWECTRLISLLDSYGKRYISI